MKLYNLISLTFILALCAYGSDNNKGGGEDSNGAARATVVKLVRLGPVMSRGKIKAGSHRAIADGDLWPMTWGDDGNLYTAYGDGFGWGKEKWLSRAALIRGLPAGWSGQDLGMSSAYGYADMERCPNGINVKPLSIISVDGVLYLFNAVWAGRFPGLSGGIKLIWSSDHGATWWNYDGTSAADYSCDFNKINKFTVEPGFAADAFLQQGKDNALSKDGYVYLYGIYSLDEPYKIVLARVPKDKIRQRSAYEWFKTRDPNGNPVWTPEIKERGVVYTFPTMDKDMGPFGAVYIPALNVYILAAHSANSDRSIGSGLWFIQARYPWGPWTQVGHFDHWGKGYPDKRYCPKIPAKWISNDGKTLYIVYSGREMFDVLNVQKVTLVLSK